MWPWVLNARATLAKGMAGGGELEQAVRRFLWRPPGVGLQPSPLGKQRLECLWGGEVLVDQLSFVIVEKMNTGAVDQDHLSARKEWKVTYGLSVKLMPEESRGTAWKFCCQLVYTLLCGHHQIKENSRVRGGRITSSS